MDFTNSFSVRAPIDQVWSVLTDARRVAPCVPGAELTEVLDETHFKGTVKIKLGAVQMSYRGELEMEPDVPSRTITLRARGTEVRGSGGASGTVVTRLMSPSPEQTDVEIHSQVDVTGRVAQFGRGIMQDVANRLIKQFVACLEERLESGPASSDRVATAPSDEATGPPRAAGQSAAGDPPDPATSPKATTAVVTPARPTLAGSDASEIKVLPLMVGVARSRLATALRDLASKVDPH